MIEIASNINVIISAILQIQAKIADLLEDNNTVGIVSLDLTAAFDVVDHELLFKRMSRAGLPNDVIILVREWLTNRTAYVECGNDTSEFF